MSLADLRAAIEAAPPGPEAIAFLDYDGTVIDGAFYRQRLRDRNVGIPELARTLLARVETIDQHVADVRGRFITTLDRWPGLWGGEA